MTNPDELRRKFERPSPRFLVTGLGLLLVLGLLAAFAARPVWRQIKAYRARQFLRAAETFLADQQYVLALERGRSALQLTPDQPDALRLCARVLGGFHGEASLNLWRRLVDLGAANPDDRATFVERALVLERADLVQDLLPALLTNQPASARLDRLAALYCLQTGRLPDATLRARSARLAEPANPTNALLLADVLLASRTPPALAEAHDLYWIAASNLPTLRLHALRRLARPPLGERADRERALQFLEHTSPRSPAEDVLAAELRITLDPSQLAVTLGNLVATLPRDDTERLTAIVETLQHLGRHTEILQLTTGARPFLNRELFLARLAALNATEDFEEAYRLSLAKGIPLAPFDLELVRADAARRTGDARRRDAHLRELLRAAGIHPARLRTAAELAEAYNAPDVATEGWKILTQQPAEAPQAWRRLQLLADRQGDTWTARDCARRALRLGDPEPTLRLVIAYYDLLLDDAPDRALAEAERQLEPQPDSFFARTVVALGHLRLGDPRRAQSTLDRLTVAQNDLRPDALAVLSAVYGANGLTNRAIALASHIPLARLRPEERDLIRPWLLAASTASPPRTPPGPALTAPPTR